MKLENICGIYCIENLIDGKKYIGKSKNIRLRWNHHRSNFRKNLNKSVYLQNAWNKYGEENFRFYILDECAKDNDILNYKEKFYIESLGTLYPSGYNLTSGGEGAFGYKLSPETRKKIGDSKKGNTYRRGSTSSDETKRKLSESHMGHKVSAETKLKMSISGKIRAEKEKALKEEL